MLECIGPGKVRAVRKSFSVDSARPIIGSVVSPVVDEVHRWLFPPMCPLCYRPTNPHALWCDRCRRELEPCRLHPSRMCRRCGLPTGETIRPPASAIFNSASSDPVLLDRVSLNRVSSGVAPVDPCCDQCRGRKTVGPIDRFLSVYAYHEVVADAVVAAKFSSRAALIRSLAAELGERIGLEPAPPPDVVTWVPSHPFRRVARGGCTPELLARWAMPIAVQSPVVDLLRVTRRLRKQAWLDDDHRMRNMRGAFAVRRRWGKPVWGRGNGLGDRGIHGKSILVIDDVITSGATMTAVAEILKRAGAASVWAASVARTIRR